MVSSENTSRIIVVELDGTLVNADMLLKNLFLFLRRHPLRFFSFFVWLLAGTANFKRRLADAVLPEVDDVPFNKVLLSWLGQQKVASATLVMATASAHRIANAVADHLGIFDEVLGTDERNLSSERKRLELVACFGGNCYE